MKGGSRRKPAGKRQKTVGGKGLARKGVYGATAAALVPRATATGSAPKRRLSFEAIAAKQIVEIRKTLQLSGPELAGILRVSRQAVEQWHAKGVPIDKAAAVDRIAEAVAELGRRFKAQRLPTIVRQPMPILDDRSIIDTLRDDGAEAIFEFFQRWSSYVPGIAPVRKGEKFS